MLEWGRVDYYLSGEGKVRKGGAGAGAAGRMRNGCKVLTSTPRSRLSFSPGGEGGPPGPPLFCGAREECAKVSLEKFSTATGAGVEWPPVAAATLRYEKLPEGSQVRRRVGLCPPLSVFEPRPRRSAPPFPALNAFRLIVWSTRRAAGQPRRQPCPPCSGVRGLGRGGAGGVARMNTPPRPKAHIRPVQARRMGVAAGRLPAVAVAEAVCDTCHFWKQGTPCAPPRPASASRACSSLIRGISLQARVPPGPGSAQRPAPPRPGPDSCDNVFPPFVLAVVVLPGRSAAWGSGAGGAVGRCVCLDGAMRRAARVPAPCVACRLPQSLP